MKTKRLSTLQVLALLDISGIAWALSFAVLCKISAWGKSTWFLVLDFAFCLCAIQFFSQKKVIAWQRWAQRTGKALTTQQSKARYNWMCAWCALSLFILAWLIPFGLTSAAFWCIYIIALVLMAVFLQSVREDLLGKTLQGCQTPLRPA